MCSTASRSTPTRESRAEREARGLPYIGGTTVASTPYTVTNGIVLRETVTKESDKILTLLTRDLGRVSVIARGARRKNSKFAACAQSLAYGEWTLYRRGEWYYANDAETLELFTGLRQDLEAMALGFYMAELTESVTTEDTASDDILRHLLNGLYALSALHKPPRLVKAAFELKLLALAGYEPLADGCAYCGLPDPEEPMLDVVQGVLHCRRCGRGERALSMPLGRDSLAALRHILYGDPKRLFSFPIDALSMQRMGDACEAFLLTQMERGFRTLDFYKQLTMNH